MTDDFANEIPTKPLISPLLMIMLVALAGLLFAWLLRGLTPPGPGAAAPSEWVGQPFPEIVVEGWLNGPGPTAADLAGKVRVIEAWAHWCGPCLELAPHLVELDDQYRDRGVVFIGLTSEGDESLDRSREFLKRAKIPWPNGYGAGPTLSVFYPNSDMSIPVMWVVDKQGKIAFHGHPAEMPPELLDELLK